MKKQLKYEIEKLQSWSSNLTEIPESERGREWEENYSEWGIIYKLFTEFIETENYSSWEKKDIKLVLYLIARNNEMELDKSPVLLDKSRYPVIY